MQTYIGLNIFFDRSRVGSVVIPLVAFLEVVSSNQLSDEIDNIGVSLWRVRATIIFEY